MLCHCMLFHLYLRNTLASRKQETSITMDSSRILAQWALAELFDVLKPQKAHWYSIKAPTIEDPSSNRIEQLFPYLGTLLSLTAEIMHFVLEASSLMRWKDKKKGILSPCLKSWRILSTNSSYIWNGLTFKSRGTIQLH
jgi:hypothetical protein